MVAVPLKVDGNALGSTDIIKLIDTDLVGGNSSGVTYDLIGDLTVPAGEISTFIIIEIIVESRTIASDATTSPNALDIRLGTAAAASLTNPADSIQEFDPFDRNSISTTNEDSVASNRLIKTLRFFFIPSGAFISSGFNIGIFGKGQSGVSQDNCGILGIQALVWGI